jgi:O-antigen/teichoic acid export membrane protein
MYSASFAVLQKKFAFKKIFVADGVMLLLSNILGIALAYYHFGVMSLVYSQLFYFGAEMIVLLYYAPIPIKLGFSKKHFKDLIGYGTGLTLIRFNTYIVNFGIILEVGKLVKAATLGVFDRSFRIMNIPQRFLYDMVQRVMMPAMVKKTDSAKGTFTAFSRTLSFVITLLLPLTVFLIIFSKPVVLVLLGKRWLDAVLMLQIFFLNLPMRTSASLGDTLMRVHGLIRLNLIRKVQNSVIICTLIYIGFKWNGIIGISWGIFISTFISYVMMMFIIKNRIFQDDWKKLVFRPYYNGLIVTICWVLPLYPLYLGINAFIKDEIISFIILCSITAVLVLLAFLKKPALLGSDVAYIQEDFIEMFKKKKKKKNLAAQTVSESSININE